MKNWFMGPDDENTESNRGSQVLILRILYSSIRDRESFVATYSPTEKIVERLVLLQELDPLDDAPHDNVGCTQAADLNVLHLQGLRKFWGETAHSSMKGIQ